MSVYRGYFQTEVGCVALCIWHCDTTAELPSSGMSAGDFAFDKQTAKLYKATNATTLVELAAGAGGPVIMEAVTSDPESPTVGQIWIRTDL